MKNPVSYWVRLKGWADMSPHSHHVIEWRARITVPGPDGVEARNHALDVARERALKGRWLPSIVMHIELRP